MSIAKYPVSPATTAPVFQKRIAALVAALVVAFACSLCVGVQGAYADKADEAAAKAELMAASPDLSAVMEAQVYGTGYQWGPIMYRLLNDGTLQITGYRNGATATAITIPKQIDHMGEYRTVSSIQYGAFRQVEEIQKVTIEADIKSIPDVCFYKCPNLKEVNLPNTVQSVGKVAFYGCTSLTTVSLGTSLDTLGEEAFYGCKALESIALPDSLAVLGEGVFAGCSALKSIAIPEKVSEISREAFAGCSSLATVTLENGLQTIGELAFNNCKLLVTLTIPDSVTTIGKEAFRYAQGLTSAKLPSGLVTLGDSAFGYCTHLADVGQIPTTLTDIGAYVFANTAIEYLALPDTITSIPTGMFFACRSLKSIALPDTLKSIGQYAFASSALEYLRVPGSVTSVNNYAFKDLKDTKMVYFENGDNNWTGALVFGETGAYEGKGLTIVCNAGSANAACKSEALALGATFKTLAESGSYQVQHDANGGSGTMGAVVLPKDMAYALPLCKFTKNAADFKEWKGPDDTRYQLGQAMPANGSSTMNATAIWDDWGPGGGYTITFTPGDHGTGTPYSVAVKKGSSITLPATCPFTADEGYTFYGWQLPSYYMPGPVQPGSSWVPNGNWTIKASWVGERTITFDGNGGTVTPATMKTNGQGRLASWPDATRDGYVLDCWSTTDDEAGQVTLGHVYTTDETLHAIWEKLPEGSGYMVNFDANGGTLPAGAETAITDPSGKLASLPVPTRDGYVFTGWYLSDMTTKVITDTVFSASAKVYAAWVEGTVETIPMHRVYNPNSFEHFYTGNDAEFANLVSLGWQDEGIGWTAPSMSSTPVYRLYNPNNGGDHHYTKDAAERDMLIAAGWSDENVGWYSDDTETVPVYREYNPNELARNHNYTADKAEHDFLVSLGWHDEGIAWYGL